MHPQGRPAGPPDWYAVLNVAAAASTEEITAALERMSRQATALSVTAPDRSRLLRDQVRAIRQDLLSGDAQRRRYDAARAMAAGAAAGPGQAQVQASYQQRPGQQVAQFAGLVSRVARFLQTGWTCANCGNGALPNDKFCPKCGSRIEAPAIAQQPPRAPWQPAGYAGGAPAGQQARMPARQQAGQPQEVFCGKCGGSIAPGNTFCTQCGAHHT